VDVGRLIPSSAVRFPTKGSCPAWTLKIKYYLPLSDGCQRRLSGTRRGGLPGPRSYLNANRGGTYGGSPLQPVPPMHPPWYRRDTTRQSKKVPTRSSGPPHPEPQREVGYFPHTHPHARTPGCPRARGRRYLLLRTPPTGARTVTTPATTSSSLPVACQACPSASPRTDHQHDVAPATCSGHSLHLLLHHLRPHSWAPAGSSPRRPPPPNRQSHHTYLHSSVLFVFFPVMICVGTLPIPS
jgi:hypothetical protein